MTTRALVTKSLAQASKRQQGACINNMHERLKSTAAPVAEAGKFEKTKLKSFDEMPAVTTLPIIGIAWAYMPFIGKYNPLKMDEANMQKYKEYGKIVREDITKSEPMVHLFDVKDIEKLARYEGKIPHRDPLMSLEKYREERKEMFTTGGLLASNGKEWYDMRSKVQAHLLKPKSILSYLPGLDGVALEMVDKIGHLLDDNNEVTNLMPELYKWALESISLIALETKLNCLEDGNSESETAKLINSVNTVFRLWFQLEFSALKFWRYLPSKIHRKFVRHMTIFTEITRKYIHEAKARMDANRDEDREATLLETFFYKEKMDERDATTMISDMILGGIDTTSHSVAFSLYHLAINQKEQEKAYQEICKVAPDANAPLNTEVINQLRYLKACVKESLRLIPIISASSRRLKEDIELSGYLIPAGVLLLTENLLISRLEENFEEADKYKPERWLRGANSTKLNPFASLPFSMGTRSCIGKRIAEQEMWTLMTRILQKYKIEYHYEEIKAVTRLVNTPDKPLRFRFLKR